MLTISWRSLQLLAFLGRHLRKFSVRREKIAMKNATATAALICAIHLFASGCARADVVYQTGFENPPFNLGPIAGQDSWNVFSGGGTNLVPVIQNAVKFA